MKRYFPAILFILIFAVVICSGCGLTPKETEPPPPTDPPPTQIPPTEPPPTAAVVIATQEITPEPLPTEPQAASVPTSLGTINSQSVVLLERLVQIDIDNITDLEFSPDAQYLRMRIGFPRETHTDIFMDITLGKEVFRLDGNQKVYFNPNSTTIASLDGNSLVEYDLRTGEALSGYNSRNEVAALSPGGQWLIVFEEIDEDGPGTTFQIVDISTEEVIHRVFVNAVLHKEDFKFSADGELLAATYKVPPNSYVTTFWSIETGKAVHSLYGYSEITFHPTPYTIWLAASNAEQDYISIYEIGTWERRRYLGSALDGPNYYDVGITSYGGLIYALYDGLATYPWFWYPPTGERTYWMSNVDLTAITISPTSKMMATADKRGYVLLWGIPQ